MISRGDTKLKVWDISNGAIQSTPIAEHVIERGRETDCCWSPDGEWIAFGETHATDPSKPGNPPKVDSSIHVWNAHTMIEHRVFSQEAQSSYPTYTLIGFSADSRQLAWSVQCPDDFHYCIWDVGADKNKPPRRVPATAKPNSALEEFRSLSFDPQGKRAVTTHWRSPKETNPCVQVWDNDTGELLLVVSGH